MYLPERVPAPVQDTIGRESDYVTSKIIVPLLAALTVVMPTLEGRGRGALHPPEVFSGFPSEQVRP